MDKKYCLNCGKEITLSARKCKYCNAKVSLNPYEAVTNVCNKGHKQFRKFFIFCIVIYIVFCSLFLNNKLSGVYLQIPEITSPQSVDILFIRDVVILFVVLSCYINFVVSLLKKYG